MRQIWKNYEQTNEYAVAKNKINSKKKHTYKKNPTKNIKIK